jgi:formylglycine-generating enzyme required for sulfatase activity
MKQIPRTYALLAVLLTANAADLSPGSFSPTIANPSTSPGPVPEGMVWIPGGEFWMGANGEWGSLHIPAERFNSDHIAFSPEKSRAGKKVAKFTA